MRPRVVRGSLWKLMKLWRLTARRRPLDSGSGVHRSIIVVDHAPLKNTEMTSIVPDTKDTNNRSRYDERKVKMCIPQKDGTYVRYKHQDPRRGEFRV